MSFVLIKFERDWADEFSPFGFDLMPKEKWDLCLAALKSVKDLDTGWYFGTNEGFEDITFQWFIDNLKSVEITADEATMIVRVFGSSNYSYGLCPDMGSVFEDIEDDDVTPEVKAFWNYVNKS